MRYLTIACVALLLAVHAIASFGVWQAAVEPARPGGLVEARSGALTALADMELRIGLAALSDRSNDASDRLEVYREQLRISRGLLIRSLDVNPAQPAALATLATVDYELNPTDRATREQARERVETAARLAPRVPRVQAQLGELLLRMGHSTEALGYLARSAELDATSSEHVVRLAVAYGLRAQTIRDALPHNASALTALYHAFESGGFDRYLEWVDSAVDAGSIEPTDALLWVYGDAALAAERAARLAERMDAWGPFEDSIVEAARCMQQTRAALELENAPAALEWAQRGHLLDPQSQKIARLLGDTARAASRPELAVEAYRHGLGLLARRNAPPNQRAFFYRRIGEAQEELHRTDLAYDAYVKALELHPEEPHAARRAAALAQ